MPRPDKHAIQRIEGAGSIGIEILKEERERGKRLTLLRIRDTGSPLNAMELEGLTLLDLDPVSFKSGPEAVRLSICRYLASSTGWNLELTNRPTSGVEAILRMEVRE